LCSFLPFRLFTRDQDENVVPTQPRSSVAHTEKGPLSVDWCSAARNSNPSGGAVARNNGLHEQFHVVGQLFQPILAFGSLHNLPRRFADRPMTLRCHKRSEVPDIAYRSRLWLWPVQLWQRRPASAATLQRHPKRLLLFPAELVWTRRQIETWFGALKPRLLLRMPVRTEMEQLQH
jgi:hypothetical protein